MGGDEDMLVESGDLHRSLFSADAVELKGFNPFDPAITVPDEAGAPANAQPERSAAIGVMIALTRASGSAAAAIAAGCAHRLKKLFR